MTALDDECLPFEDVFWFAKSVIERLRQFALEQRTGSASQLDSFDALKFLKQVHSMVQSALLQYSELEHATPSSECFQQQGLQLLSAKLLARLRKWYQTHTAAQAAVAVVFNQPVQEVAGAFLFERAELLRSEIEEVKGYAEHSQDPQLFACTQQLCDLITSLRQTEQSMAFNVNLAATVQVQTDESDYTTENFSYGSTPFLSWITIFKSQHVWPKVCQVMRGTESKYMVWGSSVGWLLAYASITFGWSCIGYELLPYLVEVADELKHKLKLGTMETVQDNLLRSSLEGVGVLLIANQCWDRDLQQQAYGKITSELAQGSIVIDYVGHLSTYLGQPIAVIEAGVSWNKAHKFYVYEKLC